MKEFGAYALRVAGGKKQTVEGKFTFITYVVVVDGKEVWVEAEKGNGAIWGRAKNRRVELVKQ